MRKALLALLLLTATTSGFANDWYVRKGATGSNNGTDWNNAWTEINQVKLSNVACGDTVWIAAGGTYTTDITMNKTCTSGNVLTFSCVRSTDSVPTSESGWNSSFSCDNNQVLIQNAQLTAEGAYWKWDGRVGDAASGVPYGIKFAQTSDGVLGTIANDRSTGANNITISHVEVIGPSCVASGSCNNSNWAFQFSNGASYTNVLVDHVWFHQMGEVIRLWSQSNGSSITIQYSSIGEDDKVNNAEHEDLNYSSNPCPAMTLIGNRWYSSGNDGFFMDNSGCNNGFVAYNNIFFHNGGWAIEFGKSGTCGPYELYNNIFESDGNFGEYSQSWIGTGGCTPASGSAIVNNIFYHTSPNASSSGAGLAGIESYNAATSDYPNPKCTGCITYSPASPLCSYSGWKNMCPAGATATTIVAADFHLTSSGEAQFGGKGTNLAAKCSKYPGLCSDLDGNPRPQSGAWTLGPYETGSSSTSNPPSAPTNLNAIVQ
jgi:hypothetical protein